MHHTRTAFGLVIRTVVGVAAVAAFIALGVGCTFLVSFDDVARPDGGISDASSESATKDTGGDDDNPPIDGGFDTSPPGTPDVCDQTFDLTTVKGCEGFQNNGQICADTMGFMFAPGYDASADVITCSKAGPAHASCIKHCRGPGKCAHNPNGFPDQCDQCVGKANGTYCGGQMAGWASETFNLLVTCANDRVSKTTTACAVSCDPKGGTGLAVCK